MSKAPGYTMPQLAARLKVSRKTVAERLKKLKEKGMIERAGSARQGY
ncbi:winged helix-turn-helix domain-containing protein [Succinatimonas hippei]